jgi:Nuclease-related domain
MTNTAPQQSAPLNADDPPMSLDAARHVIWQVQPKEPMGQLLDQGKLTRSDLEWAVAKAYRVDVRRAAQRLLLGIDQPTPPAATPAPGVFAPTAAPVHRSPAAAAPSRFGARVVIASDYLEEQESWHGWLLAYYIGLAIGMAVLTINTILGLLQGQALWRTALVIIANIGAWIWLIVVVRRQIDRVRSFRAGRKGEVQVVEQLRTALDHQWTIYRNLQLPDRTDDLDLVLVGLGGVWAVQVKATSAPLRVHAGRWQVRRSGRWVAATPDPGAQVTRQAKALNDFFKRNGLTRFVERDVALSEPQPFDQFTESEIPVWLPFDIERRAQALATRHPPPTAELAWINELLGQRAIEQRAVEAAGKRRR